MNLKYIPLIFALTGNAYGQTEEIYQRAMDMVVKNNTIAIDEFGQKLSMGGTGFVIGDKYISLDHVTTIYDIDEHTELDRDLVEYEDTYLKGIKLEKIVEDKATDIAVFRLPENLCRKYCNDGVEFDTEYTLGKKVFWIGFPDAVRKILRHGRIGNSKPSEEPEREMAGAISLDIYITPGSSGSPVFNMDGDIMGVLQYLKGGVGYFKPISEFEEYLEDD